MTIPVVFEILTVMQLTSIFAIYLYMTIASSIFQAVCLAYLIHLRKPIGFDSYDDNGVLLSIMIGLVLVYDIIYGAILIDALGTPGIQFVEQWGWWFGFVFPVGKGIVTLIFTRRLARGVSPNHSPNKAGAPMDPESNSNEDKK